jgi:hypothetical protein
MRAPDENLNPTRYSLQQGVRAVGTAIVSENVNKRKTGFSPNSVTTHLRHRSAQPDFRSISEGKS